MPSTRPALLNTSGRPPVRPSAWLLAGLLAGCVTTAPTTEAPATAAQPAAKPAATQPALGAVIPFKFEPQVQTPWGLRVQRHRTLPSQPGSPEPMHFDSEENSRLWATRDTAGDWTLEEVLTGHAETKNGDPDEDPLLVALTGVPVGMRITPEGRWRSAVDSEKTVTAIARRLPREDMEFASHPELFTKDLERDWRLGAEVYFTRPIHVNEPVYSLLQVSLPQLPGKYVVVAERFTAPVAKGDNTSQVSSTQELFGRADPRWNAAREQLEPLMKSLEMSDDDVLVDFNGTGGETVGVQSLQVFTSSYQGSGVFPLVTPRAVLPLRFEIEEVAGAIGAPPLPVDSKQTANLPGQRLPLALGR